MRSDAFLAWTGRDESDASAAKLLAFQRLFTLLSAAEAWHALHLPSYRARLAFHVALALAFSFCALVAWWPKGTPQMRRVAMGSLLVLAVVDLVAVFPENANHQYLRIVCAFFVVVADPERPVPREAALQGLRWLVVVGFFWAGVQKLVYGQWLGGEFLALRVATDPNFAAVLWPLLPVEELQRLQSQAPAAGAGPYRVDAPLFLLASNVAWLAELVLPVLLLVPRTRALGAWGCVLFVVAIESAARELFFGALMIVLALLHLEARWIRRALPPLALAVFALLAMSAGWLPGFGFG